MGEIVCVYSFVWKISVGVFVVTMVTDVEGDFVGRPSILCA